VFNTMEKIVKVESEEDLAMGEAGCSITFSVQ
jgi:hypothetical protein